MCSTSRLEPTVIPELITGVTLQRPQLALKLLAIPLSGRYFSICLPCR
jgi:hypothetical protein